MTRFCHPEPRANPGAPGWPANAKSFKTVAQILPSATILRDENSVLTVSTLLRGEYGIEDLCLSVPCVVGEKGVVRIVDAPLAPAEQDALSRSAQAVAQVLAPMRP